MDDESHPLYGKDMKCPKCEGVAVWVCNGHMVGNYHYCRACKIETGPFAKSTPPPPPPDLMDIIFEWPKDLVFVSSGPLKKRKGWSPTTLQVDTQMEWQDHMDQLLFDFMRPPSADHPV